MEKESYLSTSNRRPFPVLMPEEIRSTTVLRAIIFSQLSAAREKNRYGNSHHCHLPCNKKRCRALHLLRKEQRNTSFTITDRAHRAHCLSLRSVSVCMIRRPRLSRCRECLRSHSEPGLIRDIVLASLSTGSHSNAEKMIGSGWYRGPRRRYWRAM